MLSKAANQRADFEYRCQRCCQSLYGPTTSVANARTVLAQILVGDMSFQTRLIGGSMLTPVTVHSCADGGQGRADLVGYRVVKEISP